MITLTRQENIEIYECLLTIKEQDKQNPLVAVLILAKELEDQNKQINPEILHQTLFPIFPIQYCESILNDFKKDDYFSGHNEFKLTEKGIEASENSILWKEKTGIYHILKSDSNVIKSKIIHLKSIENNYDFDKNATNNLPYSLEQMKNYPIENGTKIISEIKAGFKKETKISPLKVEIFNDEINYKIDEYSFTEKEKLNDKDELQLLCDFLNKNEFEYKISNTEVKITTNFDENNLFFKRKILIKKPTIKNISFDDFEIELKHIPTDLVNAQLWYEAILTNELKEYHTDNQMFMNYAVSKTEAFQNQFKLKIPTKKTIIEILKTKENSFYKIAKLETINFLNY